MLINTFVRYLVAWDIPDICQFFVTTALVGPVKGTKKVR